MNKNLPNIIIDSGQEGIEIGNGKDAVYSYHLKLLDAKDVEIKNYSAINNDVKAILTVTVTRITDEFPDSNKWVTYKFANLQGLEKNEDGTLKFPKNIEDTLRRKMNKFHGRLVESQIGELGNEKPHKIFSDKGWVDTDIKYKVAVNASSDPLNPPIRLDVYQDNNPASPAWKIFDDKLEIKLVWNKRVQINLETDGLMVVNSPVSEESSKRFKIEIWHIALGVFAILLILGIIFRQKIMGLFGKKKKKEEESLSDLGVF